MKVAVSYSGERVVTETDEGEQPVLKGVRRGVFVQRAEVCEVVAVTSSTVILRTRTGVRNTVPVAEAVRLGGMVVVKNKPFAWPWEGK